MRYRELFPDIPKEKDGQASPTPKNYQKSGLSDEAVDSIISQPRPVRPSDTEKARRERIDDANRERSLSKKLNLKPKAK